MAKSLDSKERCDCQQRVERLVKGMNDVESENEGNFRFMGSHEAIANDHLVIINTNCDECHQQVVKRA